MSELREVFASLKSVVDDLTDLGALGGGAPLNAKATDVTALIASEARVAAAMAQRKALTFTTDFRQSPLILEIDGPRVRQVVRNLLSNGIKYTDRGGIKLSLTTKAGAGKNTLAASIVVQDSGPGFSETQLLHLFEPFDRGERDDADGLGLGLALSRRIAERMGGTLTAESRPRLGASFIFSFDAHPASLELASNASVPAPLHILLVEDVALNRRMIATMLKRAGHRVSEASDGKSALVLSEEFIFDLVLLDLGLPDMSGFEVLESFKRLPKAAATKIIILTASTLASAADRAIESGAALVLRKPVSIHELKMAIASLFSLQDASDTFSQTEYEAEYELLEQSARGEILSRGRRLLEQNDEKCELIRNSHRLAGLAAQFGAAAIAAAADRLEAALRDGTAEAAALKMLEATLHDYERATRF